MEFPEAQNISLKNLLYDIIRYQFVTQHYFYIKIIIYLNYDFQYLQEGRSF